MDRHTSKAKLEEHVDHIVSTLGMDKFLHTRISLLSGGERKKVALAVQLLGDPPILFCDEITTGLDAYSAAHIVNTLKSVARTGKIVVCTIHQPASGVFGKFDEVVLLTRGRLAYHGPVSLVGQFFKRFGYVCPDMFNEADYVISILNSITEIDKKNVDEMCKWSASESQMIRINYDLFNNKKQIFSYEHQTQKPVWTTHFRLILDRSFKCFLRNYKTKLLELGISLYMATVVSAPFSNIKLDTNTVQNWEGFWLFSTIYMMAFVSFFTMSSHRASYSSAVHREVHNSVYPLSVYYASESMLSMVWVTARTLIYCVYSFWIVGVDSNQSLSLVWSWLMAAWTAFSYGSLVVSYFNRMENALIFHTIYLCLSLSMSGAYSSLVSLPKVLYYLRYLSIAFLGCETVSIVFWTSAAKTIPCDDVINCLDSGQAVLQKHGYISNRLPIDVLIMVTFFIVSFVYSYFRVLKKMKKQPAY